MDGLGKGMSSQMRLGIAQWLAFGAQAVGLTVGFVLAEPTSLKPEYADVLVTMCVLLIAGSGAIVSCVIALARRKPGAAWWAATSATAIAALMMLPSAGMGIWFPWCAVALCAPLIGMFASLRRERTEPEDTGPGPTHGAGRAAVALSAVALTVSMFSGAGIEDVDYSGTWTTREHDVTLTLSGSPGGRGSYTLRSATCSEEADWSLRNPQMSTSVQVWLLRDSMTTRCIPGPDNIRLYVAGGTVAKPVLSTTGPNGTAWFLTRQ
ncbi:hypothetical protein [Streptomyces sp. NBC_01006]|uniref:hypothetical protein n=1 Tax=Streptomyces sp. NBC_01006 TaxID=2903716 RepID=UPI003870E636|nr:hypothetical protein OG509_01065 [Streptomyces sp. NBC_01006]